MMLAESPIRHTREEARSRHLCEDAVVPPMVETDSLSTSLHLQHISCMAWRSKVPMLSLALAAFFLVADALAQ